MLYSRHIQKGKSFMARTVMFRLLAVLSFVVGLASVSIAATSVDISINKVSQKMTVTVDGQRKYVWPVSTGARGYDTPSGSFRPFRMEKEHFSKEWDDAPMPHSVFFTGRGHAIHGSYYVKSLGRRASHGCVRLAPQNAATLFSLVQKAGMKNTRITLRGGFFDGGYSEDFDQEMSKTAAKLRKFQRKAKRRLNLFGGLDG
jgi:L,D-transpeptidase catalytic domain